MNNIDELKKFTEEIAAKTPTPGGGSVAAYCGAMSAALSAMVMNYTAGRKDVQNELEIANLLNGAQEYREKFLQLMQQDIDAYAEYSAAVKMPKETESEREARSAAMQKALCMSTEIPLQLIAVCRRAASLALAACHVGNQNLLSDSAAAAVFANAAAKAATFNIRINLPKIADKKLADSYCRRMEENAPYIDELVQWIECYVTEHLERQFKK